MAVLHQHAQSAAAAANALAAAEKEAAESNAFGGGGMGTVDSPTAAAFALEDQRAEVRVMRHERQLEQLKQYAQVRASGHGDEGVANKRGATHSHMRAHMNTHTPTTGIGRVSGTPHEAPVHSCTAERGRRCHG